MPEDEKKETKKLQNNENGSEQNQKQFKIQKNKTAS